MTPEQFHLAAYDYELPPEQIAQTPSLKRDQSRLLVLQRSNNELEHRRFKDILDYLSPEDLLVVNDTKVFPARLLGRKATGGKVEMLLLHFPDQSPPKENSDEWQQAEALALIKSSKRPQQGSLLHFTGDLRARVDSLRDDGKVAVTLLYRQSGSRSLEDLLTACGQVPLPPYISRPKGTTSDDVSRYQTRYANHTGSVAAPTAGLHFSDDLLKSIDAKGVHRTTVTLHVGYGTFAPVRSEDIRRHAIHSELVEVSKQTAEQINAVRAKGGRIWAVGTTTVRTLEFAADAGGRVHPLKERCGLFIYPGYKFKIVDNLITNFHLPKSSLLFLVSALAGRERILEAYKAAVEQRYRFFSYGDAMAIIR